MLDKQDVTQVVRGNILPFWQGLLDKENGGFYGQADFFGKPDKTADKGGILHSRILWTFSAAYGLFGDEAYKASAAAARDFLLKAFLDKEHGGLYWLADCKGKTLNDRKQFYNLAFGIYALSEHFRVTGECSSSSLDLAYDLFDKIETYSFDPVNGGYIEACKRDWSGIDDFRLSAKEINCPKSMNTCLHVLEAYTNLLRAKEDERVRNALKGLLRVTLDKIVNKNFNFNLFFDMEWKSLCKEVSWGHDIEGSWLLYEAALALGEEKIILEVKQTALEIAEAIYNAAIDKRGGLFSGCNEAGKIPVKKDWWSQAEAVVGFYNAYELSGLQKYFDAASAIWDFIQKHFIDSKHGEWHNEVDADNKPDAALVKAGFWKCPYHNSRACFELVRRMK